MGRNFWVIAISALFVVCASGLEGEREGWFPGLGGDTKPVSPTIIGVRGAIFCKKGLKLTPIQGACAQVTCDSSPFNYCHVKTNLNNGLSGAPLKTSKSIPKQHLKVFYVGPFAFTQQLRA